MTSTDEYSWTAKQGLKAGLPCIGKITPLEKSLPLSDEVVDVIVLGSGYAGLVAANSLKSVDFIFTSILLINRIFKEAKCCLSKLKRELVVKRGIAL